VKLLLKVLRETFKEVAGRWWSLLAFFSMQIIGVLSFCVGFLLMLATGSDTYSNINYGSAIDILEGFMPRIVEQSAIAAIQWVLHRSLLFLHFTYLLTIFLLLFQRNQEVIRA